MKTKKIALIGLLTLGLFELTKIIVNCVKNKKSLNVKIRDFTELLTPDDLINDIENNQSLEKSSCRLPEFL